MGGFRYTTGFWGHVFGISGLREVILDEDSLVLYRKTGQSLTLNADDIVPPIQRRRGLFWSAIKFRTTDGREIRLDGIRVTEARTLAREIEAWIAPARAAHYERVRIRLEALGNDRETFLSGSSYVRASTQTVTSVEWRGVLKTVLRETGD